MAKCFSSHRRSEGGKIAKPKRNDEIIGLTPFTPFADSKYKTAKRAKNRLSLEKKPEVQMEFKVKNTPKLERNGTKVTPRYGGEGKGKEFMTLEQVEVEVINVQPYPDAN